MKKIDFLENMFPWYSRGMRKYFMTHFLSKGVPKRISIIAFFLHKIAFLSIDYESKDIAKNVNKFVILAQNAHFRHILAHIFGLGASFTEPFLALKP